MANEKKVQSHHLGKVGDEIRTSTGWDDPVDLLTSIAKIEGANAPEMLVKEKRRIEEEDPSRSP